MNGPGWANLTPEQRQEIQARRTENWQKAWKREAWNSVRARIEGNPPRITTWLNDEIMFQGTDTENHAINGATEGSIAIQVHGGERWRAGGFWRWRVIAVKELPDTAPGSRQAEAEAPASEAGSAWRRGTDAQDLILAGSLHDRADRVRGVMTDVLPAQTAPQSPPQAGPQAADAAASQRRCATGHRAAARGAAGPARRAGGGAFPAGAAAPRRRPSSTSWSSA